MKNCSICIAVTIPLTMVLSVLAAENTRPVRMGCGLMTFDTVPGWGLRPDGRSALGPTHGAVVIDKTGNIYTSAKKGVLVFSPDGKVIHSYLGKDYSDIHDMEIRQEAGGEFIYGARNNNAEGIKFNISNGDIVLKLKFPKESGLNIDKFNPTAITVAPNDDIFLSNGYASNHIFKYDKTGKYLLHFGSKGNGLKQFNTAHGMTLDTRYDPHRLLICDRNHKPKGRLLHYDLNGEFIAEVVTGLGMPTSAAVQGDYVSVPDLHGRLVILDKSNTIIAVLGHNSDPKTRVNFNVPQSQWIEGIFSGTHGSYWDKDGNLYVQDWNVSGRIMKLVRVKTSALLIGCHPPQQVLALLGAQGQDAVTDRQLATYRRIFRFSDANGDGQHSKQEFVDDGRYLTRRARQGIFRASDSNNDGSVSEKEYIHNRIITDEAKAIFTEMDADYDGKLTMKELIVSQRVDADLAKSVFEELDSDDNGELVIPEYLRVWGRWARSGRKTQAVVSR